MPHRCAELQLLLSLTLVSLGTLVSAQNPHGSSVDFAALDLSLMEPSRAETSNSVRTSSISSDSHVVDKHNRVRAALLAANMEYVDQTESLSGDVKAWLSNCGYHVPMQVRWTNARYPHLHGFKAKSLIPVSTSTVISIISQLPNSDGLYKTVMKSDMRYLGCGNQLCSATRTQESPYTVVACLYAFRSKLNLAEEPYKRGGPCSKCSSGTFWCYDNLCREECDYANVLCECQIDCGKYSTLTSNCSCLCRNGSDDCSQDIGAGDADDADDDDGSSSMVEGGTTLIVSITLVMLVLLSSSLCLLLYYKKYRSTRLHPETPVESRSSTTTTICSSLSALPPYDPAKYPIPPPAYSNLSPIAGSDPPPYGWTASPTDVADEVGAGEDPPPPPPYQNRVV